MGRIQRIFANNEDLKDKRLTAPSYFPEDEVGEVKVLLENNHSTIDSELAAALSTYLAQVNGHYQQLIIRGEKVLNKNVWQDFMTKKDVFTEHMQGINGMAPKEKIEKLNSVIDEVTTAYKDMEEVVSRALDDNKTNITLAKEIPEVNTLLDQIDSLIVDSDISKDKKLQEIIELYRSGLSSKDPKEILATVLLLKEEEEKVLQELKQNNQIVKAEAVKGERIFDLFAKINDQIVSHQFSKVNGLIYTAYTLEDNSIYYAIVADENKVLTNERTFANLDSINMNRESVEKALNQIIHNALVYYDLNEYTRYVEMSYKKQMTPAIDQAIEQYKKRLSNMETILKGQLQFMDDLAPVLNGHKSTKYPNIVYQDKRPKDFYPAVSTEAFKDEALEEQRKLMVNVLANDAVSNNLTSKDLLLADYGVSKVNELINNTFNKKEEVVEDVKVAEPKVEEVKAAPSVEVPTPTIVPNREKISNYLDIRKKELELIKASDTPNVNVTSETDNIYQDVNTIINLNTAAAISDRQYKDGQGIFAITHYLKTGEATRFTSNFGGREMAKTVNPNQYTAVLLENMVKVFAGSGKKAKEDPTYIDKMQPVLSFVQKELSKDTFNIVEVKNTLLSDDNLLTTAINQFDYEYLDPESEDSKLFEQAMDIGVKSENKSALKIKKALMEIKNSVKTVDIPSENGPKLAA